MTQDTLLPDNRTAFEEAVDLTGARIADLPIGLRELVQPAAVPAPHLPWLAWGLSVDLWDKDWSEEKKRARTARSLPFHAIKGTQTAIAEALAVMGADARRFIVPPAKTYLSKALTETERAAYLDRFAQLRIYPFIARGVSGRNTRFLSAPDGPGTAFAGPNNPVSIAETKYIRTAKLYDRGMETDLTVRTVTPERVGEANAISYDEVVLAPKPTAAIHLGAAPKPQAFLIDDIGVRQRIVRIPRDETYSYRLGREQYTTVLPKGDLIDVRPQQVTEKHLAQKASLFPGAAGQRVSGACLPETIAWRHLYDRWHIHDPDRVLDERKRSTHLGYTRLGMPPYTAEVLTRIKGRRHPRTAGRFVNGYVVAASTKPVTDARAAVMVAKSLRDKVLINTKTWRVPRPGDRRAVGDAEIEISNTAVTFRARNEPNLAVLSTQIVSATGAYELHFVAISTATQVQIINADGTLGDFSLADNISVRPADADRSANNRGLLVNGTVTRASVVTGAELMGYTCNSASYLSRDFAGDLNGQSTFALIFWAKGNRSSQGFRWFETPGGGTSTAFLNLYFDANTGQPRFVWQGRTSLNVGGDCPPHDGQWALHAAIFQGGLFQHYQNGGLQSSSSHGITAQLHELRISPVTTAAMALFRITNSIPTADQIRRIYEDEKVLFQENAACTFFGTSDVVTALAHDPDTGLLHVGTSAGRSVFKGLRRVANTTVPVGAAIAAAGGMVVEE